MSSGITFPYTNLHILATTTKAQSNCIFCESGFPIMLMCSLEYYLHIKIFTFWLQILEPIQLYFWPTPIINNLDLSAGITFSYRNHVILCTNTGAQPNCILCEPRFLIILICPLEYHFHIVTITFWLQILRPNPIVFFAI